MPVRDKGKSLEFASKSIRLTEGSIISERIPRLQEHWVDDLVAGRWTATETGVGAGKAAWAVAATANDGGFATGVAGATTNNAEELAAKHIIWKPSLSVNQSLVFETRLKVVGTTTPADGDFCLGLADAVTYTNGLAYSVSAASALVLTVPTEFVGFFYSSIPTSGALFNSGGNNFLGVLSTKVNVDTLAATTLAKDSLFHIYRIEVASSGSAAMFVDDNLVASINTAVTAATALTPYIAVIGQNSHNNTGTCSYITVGGDYA